MKFCVYIILCAEKRLYVGQTKLWRLKARWNEHADPACFTTKWTSKYPVIHKLKVFECGSYSESYKLEHVIVEALMKIYGLDVVRGGGWNMEAEGSDTKWWVPARLKGVPCFTETWRRLSGHRYVASVLSALIPAVIPPLAGYSLHSEYFLKRESDEPRSSFLKWRKLIELEA